MDWTGWQKQNGTITAPCGCKGVPSSYTPLPKGVYQIPQDGELAFSEFVDCGKVGDCKFRAKTRALSFREDIPLNSEVWEWMSGGCK